MIECEEIYGGYVQQGGARSKERRRGIKTKARDGKKEGGIMPRHNCLRESITKNNQMRRDRPEGHSKM